MVGRVLVTGASGFLGGHLLARLAGEGVVVRAMSRRGSGPGAGPVQWVRGDVTQPASLVAALEGVDTVFHAAGYAHALGHGEAGFAKRHRQVNRQGSEYLMQAAVAAGVGRLVYFSSVKAGSPAPDDPYAQAKRAAEERLLELGAASGTGVCVLRPALMVGPGAKGNLAAMLRAVCRHRFPPPPRMANRRSLVDVRDVAEAAWRVATDVRANGRIYVLSHAHPWSTRELYQAMCRACGRRAASWATPLSLLRTLAWLGDHRLGPLDSPRLERLIGSAWYDGSVIGEELGFRPGRDVGVALMEMAQAGR